MTRLGSLRFRLLLGAGLICLFSILASVLTIYGTKQMSNRVEMALGSEQRIQRYSGLAAQIGTFLVMAFEASQSGDDRTNRLARLDGLTDAINRSFVLIRKDLEKTVSEARDLGVDEQSLRATRSLGVARMEALFNSTISQLQLGAGDADSSQLQARLNGFSMGFDPLINAAVTEERLARDDAIEQIDILRSNLTTLALLLCAVASGLLLAFYLALVRPQLRRLSQLGAATRQIAGGNFAVSLPATQNDEIGAIFEATNATAAALAKRGSEVAMDQARLNDIVDQRTRELQVANDALAKTDADRRRFFADISHELRTPLTVILMESELALKAGDAPAPAFKIIQARAERLNRRIDDLLRIARSETGVLNMQSVRFDLAQAAALAVADNASQLDRAGMKLLNEATPLIFVQGDENWTRQLISGLIENAIRHANSGGLLRLDLRAEGGMGKIAVIDNGGGIPETDQQHVMERFQQAKTSVSSEGFGIGLALARWIIDEQAGQIDMTSPVPDPLRLGHGPGTMVTVSLPTAEG